MPESRLTSATISDSRQTISLRSPQSLSREPTPHVVFDDRHFGDAIERAVRSASRRGFTLAYSIKTNPSSAALSAAFAAGAFAEAINIAEVERALSFGWSLDEIVLNGPAKAWPTGHIPDGLLAVMCDSIAEFEDRVRHATVTGQIGLRLRPLGAKSRFGVELSNDDTFAGLADSVRTMQPNIAALAFHIHFNSVKIGVERWCDLVLATLQRGAELSRAAGVAVVCVDLGGGWDTAGLDAVLTGGPGEELVRAVRDWFPSCERLLIEPGQSVVGQSGVVYSRVVTDVVDDFATVDASAAELPFPAGDLRPVYASRGENWIALDSGSGNIYGGSAMETDIIATSVNLDGVGKGDLLAFGNAGAYDVSMRTGFGRGMEPWGPLRARRSRHV